MNYRYVVPIGQSPLGKILLELAARPCGVNCLEAVRVGYKKTLTNELLHSWFLRGHIVRAESFTKGSGAIAFQYFTSSAARDAWEALPLDQRPNAMRKRPQKIRERKTPIRKPKALKPPKRMTPIQTATWARAPLIGSVNAKKTIVRSQGISLGYDTRYELGPEASASFRGEFSKLGPGRYL